MVGRQESGLTTLSALIALMVLCMTVHYTMQTLLVLQTARQKALQAIQQQQASSQVRHAHP